MRILILDNYDSFTWNLHHLLEPLGEVTVKRNDGISVDEAASFHRIVLSPGPGLPSEAGILPELVRRLIPTHPILGICLGMQAIAEACGGSLYNQATVKHGIAVPCIPELPTDPFFMGTEAPFEVGLYHSWAVDEGSLPKELRVVAKSTEGVIMALRHKRFPAFGVQFHPESVLTPSGAHMIRNWTLDDQRSLC